MAAGLLCILFWVGFRRFDEGRDLILIKGGGLIAPSKFYPGRRR